MAFRTRPNAWWQQDSAATTQLTYALQLNPAPLTVSISGRDSILGSLEFVLTNPTSSTISLTSVTFTIQVGTTGSCLTTSTALVSTSVSDSTDWVINSPASIISGPAAYQLVSQTGSPVPLNPGASVVIEIFNFPTVENPGNTTISVKEVIGSSSGFTSFQVTTFPTGFYFNGLCATTVSGSQLVPVAQVATGSTVTLLWNCSVVDVTSFAIYYTNASQGQQQATPSDTGEWASPALTADTVFTVVVTVSIAGGAPLSAALTTAVSVQNPTLIATGITAGQATITGATTVGGTLGANAVTATGLTVSGSATADSLTTSGALNAATLAVTGQSNLGAVAAQAVSAASLTTSGGVSVGGTLTAVGINAGTISTSGAITVNGFISLNGSVMNNVSGPYNAANFANSASQVTLYTTNSTSDTIHATGIAAQVATSSDCGMATNGTFCTFSGSAMLTHLPTSIGHCVVTSPLSLHAELHLSGEASISGDHTRVSFEPAYIDMIAGGESYRVLISPLGRCPGLCVVEKNRHGFVVGVADGGHAEVAFDWLVIARKAKSAGSNEADELPERMPEIMSPVWPEN